MSEIVLFFDLQIVDGLAEEEAKRVVRCEVGDGFGQGFFVCVFSRKQGLTPEQRKKEEDKNRQVAVAKPSTTVVKKSIPKKVSKPVEKKEKQPIDYISKIKSIKKTKHGKKVPLGKRQIIVLFISHNQKTRYEDSGRFDWRILSTLCFPTSLLQMSQLNESLIKEDDSNKTSLLSCSLLLANGAIGKILFSSGLIIGAGILTLSLAVSKIGWGMSILMYVFFGRKLFFVFCK